MKAPPEPWRFDFSGDLVKVRLAMHAIQFRLRVEQVHLARAAVHEQLDHCLGFRLEVRLARSEVIDLSWFCQAFAAGVSPSRSRLNSEADAAP